MPQYFLCKVPLLCLLIATDTRPSSPPHPAESGICFPGSDFIAQLTCLSVCFFVPLLPELKPVVHLYSSKETCPQRQVLLCLEAWLMQVFMDEAANSSP